ncbi:MAG: 2OG-Fe(II) oxygenase [Chlamydiae bacterium]|nr:2OG-Fe(II) oxygenase [Chlamydiota bacterium]
MLNLYDLIIIKSNVIPPQHRKEILDSSKTQDSCLATSGQTEDSQDQDTTIRNTLWYQIAPEVYSKINYGVESCFKNIIQPRYNCDYKSHESIQHLCYIEGGHYIEHNDSENFKNGKLERLYPRDVSIIFYLNDEFTGGELEFTHLGVTIKPKSGMMVAFPSYIEFSHKVHPVKSGERHALVSWIETKERIYERPNI